jgi:hypothetical protein
MRYESQADTIRKRLKEELKKEEELVKVAPLFPDYLDDFNVRIHLHKNRLYGQVGWLTVKTIQYHSIDGDKRQPDIKTMMQLLRDLPPEPASLVKDRNTVSVRPTATLESRLTDVQTVFPVHFRCQVPYEGASSEWSFEWYTYLDGQLWGVHYHVRPHSVLNMGRFDVRYNRHPDHGPILSVERADFYVNDQAKRIKDENGTSAWAKVRYYGRGSRTTPRSPYIVWIPDVGDETPDVIQALSFLEDRQ